MHRPQKLGSRVYDRSLLFAAGALLTMAFQGCAFSAVRRPDPKPIALPYDQAVEACRAAAEAIGYQIHSASPAAGIVRTSPRPVQIPELCDCGTWNMDKVTGSAFSTLIATVSAQGNDTSVVTLDNECSTTFTGRNLYGMVTRQEAYRCASKGAMERDFWAMLDRICARSPGCASSVAEGTIGIPQGARVVTSRVFDSKKFGKITVGTTLDDVIRILGTAGMSALPASAGELIYQWVNDDGSSIRVTMMHGKVSSKAYVALDQ